MAPPEYHNHYDPNHGPPRNVAYNNGQMPHPSEYGDASPGFSVDMDPNQVSDHPSDSNLGGERASKSDSSEHESQSRHQPNAAAVDRILAPDGSYEKESDFDTFPDPNAMWWFLVKSRFLFLAAVSAFCQHHFSEILKRREVILKMLGAERLLANGLCLLLNGVSIVSQTAYTNLSLAEFLERISPPTLVCCLVVAVRKHSLLIGFSLATFPYAEKIILPHMDYGGAFFSGLLVGVLVVGKLGQEYLTNGRNCESSFAFRLCYLLPGDVSDKAVAFLDGMVSRVRNRTVQYFAVNLLERVFRFLLRY